MLAQIFEERAVQRDAVYDGRGLAYALQGQYDVMILDVDAPGRSGFDGADACAARAARRYTLLLDVGARGRGP